VEGGKDTIDNYDRYSMLVQKLVFPIALLLFLPFPGAGLVLAIPVTRLTDAEISRQLTTLPGWRLENGRLEKTFQFANFVAAIAFVELLVAPAEAIGHHPDITIRYNRVTVSLTTHDVGGLSTLDFDLARKISVLATNSG
jgi:4a-hydroxytetrahydrobiopterin dehydratase